MKHKKHILRLLKGIVDAKAETIEQQQLYWGYLTNWLPEPEGPRIFAETGMVFSGAEKYNYYESYFELRKDKQTEYLRDKELNERLSHLVSEVVQDGNAFLDEKAVNRRIAEFLGDIIKPLYEYQVLFKIHNLGVDISEVEFWDCKLARLSQDALIQWGFDENCNNFINLDFFEQQNVIVVTEVGNSESEVVDRARIKAGRRLKALQTYLKGEYIQDFQLLFRLSDEYAVRKNEPTQKARTGFKNHRAVKYDYKEFLLEMALTANADYNLLKTLPEAIRDLVERSLYWIGLSISEPDFDIKIAYLCTGLETLLTTKQDARKGEKIAYRGYLLGMEAEGNRHHQPQRILRVYEIRSSVVHGSKLGISSERDYSRLFGFSKATVSNFINFATSKGLTKQSKIHVELLKSKHLIPLLTWLEEYDDETSGKITKSIKEDWFPKLLSRGSMS